jgi:hypothetical protein
VTTDKTHHMITVNKYDVIERILFTNVHLTVWLGVDWIMMMIALIAVHKIMTDFYRKTTEV